MKKNNKNKHEVSKKVTATSMAVMLGSGMLSSIDSTSVNATTNSKSTTNTKSTNDTATILDNANLASTENIEEVQSPKADKDKSVAFLNEVKVLFTDDEMTTLKSDITLEQLNELLQKAKNIKDTKIEEKLQSTIHTLKSTQLDEQVNNLFTDLTFMTLKDDVTSDSLYKLLEESKDYASRLTQEKIQKAMDILEEASINTSESEDEKSTSSEFTKKEDTSNTTKKTTTETTVTLDGTKDDNLKNTTNSTEKISSNTDTTTDKATNKELKEDATTSTIKSLSNEPKKSEDTNLSYDDIYRISNKKIKSYSNNGGEYPHSPLSNMFDNNTATHWETGTKNTSSFKNEFTVTFTEKLKIGSLVYTPRVTGSANKGFPKKYTIYSSTEETGEDNFTKIISGTAIVASGELKINFNKEIEAKRIKFVFDEASEEWAAASELAFYKIDKLSNNVENLFTDNTFSQVQSGITLNDVNKMLEEVNNHPNKSLLIEKLKLAKSILDKSYNPLDRVFEVEQRGDGVNHARNVLLTSSYGTNLLPTGIAALAGETIKVYVEVDDGAPLPQISFTQQMGHWKNWIHTFNLKEGENTFIVPTIYDETWTNKVIPGGAIYIVNPYTKEQQGNAPKIRIEGGHAYPLFEDGEDPVAFENELKEYKEKLEKNPKKYVDIVELVNDWTIINSNMASAEATFLSDGDFNAQKTLDFHKERLTAFFEYAGIYENSSDIKHSRNGARANLRLMQPWAFAYAAANHTGFQQICADNLFAGKSYSWAEAHEIGHHFDVKGGTIGEVTNNMWANYNSVDLQGESDRMASAYPILFTTVASDDYETLATPNNINALTIFWQLHLLDKDYWKNYQIAYREGVASDMGLSEYERMSVISSYVLGIDITEHFIRHKFITGNSIDKVKSALKKLKIETPPENIKPWYLSTKATLDRESKFTKEYTPEIISLSQANGKIVLTLDIDKEADDALLGYEVWEDGKIIGFTDTNTFSTIYDDDGKEHTYKVRAYDLRLNQSKFSEEFTGKTNFPIISVVDSTIFELNDYVNSEDVKNMFNAYDSSGKKLTINIDKGSFDPAVPGKYTHTISATTEDGNKSTKIIPINVSTRTVYASEIQPKEKTIKNSEMDFNEEINLNINKNAYNYDEGLVVPINSSITYDITDKKYAYFETFIGLDRNNTINKDAAARFEIWVDGNRKFISDEMSIDSNMQYVKLDITNAKTVKLVTTGTDLDTDNLPSWADAKFVSVTDLNELPKADAAWIKIDENENTTDKSEPSTESEKPKSNTNDDKSPYDSSIIDETPNISIENDDISAAIKSFDSLDDSTTTSNNKINKYITNTTPTADDKKINKKTTEFKNNSTLIASDDKNLDANNNSTTKNENKDSNTKDVYENYPDTSNKKESSIATMGISLALTGVALISLIKSKKK